MIKEYNSKFKKNTIHICDDFPQDKLIKIMRPYLYLKLISDYSLVHIKKIAAKKKLLKKLYEFQKYNPKFGRKFIKFNNINIDGKIKKVKSHVEFSSEYKKFYNYEIENFMNNHLNYKYNPQSDDDSDSDSDSDDSTDVEITLNQYSHLIVYSQLLIDNNRTNSFRRLENTNNSEQEVEEEEERENEEEEERMNLEEEERMNLEEEERMNLEEEELLLDSELEDQDSIS
jgi:hypothetical protein